MHERSIVAAALRMQEETGFDAEGLLRAIFGPLLEECRQHPTVVSLEIVESFWRESGERWQLAYEVAEEIAQQLRIRYNPQAV